VLGVELERLRTNETKSESSSVGSKCSPIVSSFKKINPNQNNEHPNTIKNENMSLTTSISIVEKYLVFSNNVKERMIPLETPKNIATKWKIS